MRPVLIVMAALLLAASAHAQDREGSPGSRVAAKPLDNPDKGAEPQKKEAAKPAQPMVFFIATGDPDACGAGCSAWIAAEGRIDDGTPGRLRALLARLGKRKLPIYFYSPGGAVDAALAMGRMLRAHNLTAGVARTIPQGCDPELAHEPSCDTLKRSGRELAAELRTRGAACNSACVYALLGATVREVPVDASLGVHSISILQTVTRRNGDGRVVATSSTRVTGDAPSIRTAHGRVARYAAEMGISRALVDAAAAVPADTVRFITREEIAQFGIDKREFIETRWTADTGTTGSFAKLVMEARPNEPKRYGITMVRLGCSRRMIDMRLSRRATVLDKASLIVAKAGDREISFGPARSWLDPKGEETDTRIARVPIYFLERTVARDTVELIEATSYATMNTPVHRTSLSTAGFAPLLSTLLQKCQ
ncbi:MAG: hypothetical protein V7608_157 [Hyphomicrobiales bacterium]